jgi:hypothetical protein
VKSERTDTRKSKRSDEIIHSNEILQLFIFARINKTPFFCRGMEDYLTTERGRKRLRGLLYRFRIDEILIYDDGHFPAMWATMTESLLSA